MYLIYLMLFKFVYLNHSYIIKNFNEIGGKLLFRM
jgi:hypothetical protein